MITNLAKVHNFRKVSRAIVGVTAVLVQSIAGSIPEIDPFMPSLKGFGFNFPDTHTDGLVSQDGDS